MTTLPRTTRPAAVAGSFYPSDPITLGRTVDELLAVATEAQGAAEDEGAIAPKALVVPHAGYVYSGPIAASAFAHWRSISSTRVRRVILIGPAHRALVRGLVSPGDHYLSTPLGRMEVDEAALQTVPDVSASAHAHAAEHSLEVELPFIQRLFPAAQIVPLAAGDASAEQVGHILDALWGGPETRIVISSDLSHYLPYARAKVIDAETVARIVALDVDGIDHERACGATGLSGLLWVARRRGLSARLFDLRNSGDTAGDRGRVVGYAALGFYESEEQPPSPPDVQKRARAR